MDAALFKYYVARAGYTLTEVAEYLNINPSTLHRKICGETDFTRGEIVALKELLHLSLEEVNSVFFTENLA